MKIGEINTCKVSRLHDLGAFLIADDDQSSTEILLSKNQVSETLQPGDSLNVFVYKDSDDTVVASIKFPKATVGEVAWLKVDTVNNVGAFLSWGLKKDLFVPFSEQITRMAAGRWYVVMIFLDDQSRIAGSAKLNEFLYDDNEDTFKEKEEVSIIVSGETDLGYKAVVNNTHWGVLYQNELFKEIEIGRRYTAWVKKIREDDRIDLSLQKPGYSQSRLDNLATNILNEIKKENGHLPLNDKSAPEDIYKTFSVSKKQFKQAIGKLYKQRFITIESDGVHLIDPPQE